MNAAARDTYLATEVMTATPQRLQLLLIEGAIRFALKARAAWDANQADLACEALIRAQEILTQMLSSIDHQINPDLTRRVAGEYFFIYRRLVEAGLKTDRAALDDALRVLEAEQETWRLVCQRTGSRVDGPETPAPAGRPQMPPLAVDLPKGGFSVEV